MDESRTDYEEWAEDNVPEHVDSLMALLGRSASGAAPRPRRIVVDPRTGHLNRGELCWVCFAARPLRGGWLPRFRGCRECLVFDRQQASLLGLKMLLPLMDYPSQPVLPGVRPPQDEAVRRGLHDVWSRLSLLDRWRVDGVRLGCAVIDAKAESGAALHPDFAAWQRFLRPGRARTRACWTAFVGGYHRDLAMHIGMS